MRRLPRFEREEAITPQAAPTLTGYQAWANQLESEAKEFGAQARHNANIQAARSGEEKGLDPNSSAPGMALTEADKHYKEAWLSARREYLRMSIAQKAKEVSDNVLDPKNFSNNSLAEYQHQYAGAMSSIKKTVPKELEQYTQNVMQYYGTRYQDVVDKQVKALSSSQLKASYLNSFDEINKEISNTAFNAPDQEHLHAAQLLAAHQLDLAKKQLDSGLMTASQYERIKETTQDSLHSNFYKGQVHQNLLKSVEDARNYINKFSESKTPEFTPDEKMALTHEMNSMVHQHIANLGVTAQSLSRQTNNVLAQVATDGNMQSAMQWHDKLSKIAEPSVANEFWNQVKVAHYTYRATNELKMNSLPDREKWLADNKPKPSDENYAAKLKIFNAVSDNTIKDYNEFVKNPAGYIEQNDKVYHVMLERRKASSVDSSGNKIGPGTGDIDLDTHKISREKQMGLVDRKQWSLIANDDAKRMVAAIKQVDIKSQYLYLFGKGGVLDRHPGYEDVVMKDLHKAGLGYSTALLMRSMHTQVSSAPEIEQAFTTPLKEITKDIEPIDKKSIDDNIDSQLKDFMRSANTNSFSLMAYNEIKGSVAQLAYYYKAKGMYDGNEAKHAANILINNFYHYGSYRDGHYRIPNSSALSPSDVNHFANEKIEEIKKSSDFILPAQMMTNDKEADEMQKSRYFDLLDHAYVVTDPNDSAIVVVDSTGNPIRNKKGKVYKFNFDQIPALGFFKSVGQETKDTASRIKPQLDYVSKYIWK